MVNNIYADLIFLDTETTGLSIEKGDRLIEIAAIQMSSIQGERMPYFHSFCNPDGKIISKKALETHHITNEFLQDKPKFIHIVDSFLEFIKNKILVIHNAKFDLKILNNELKIIKYPPIENKFIDTLTLSKNLFPDDNLGFKLDDLCDRFGIDRSERQKGHNALVDTKLLAKAYRALFTIQQDKINFEKNQNNNF